MSYISCNRRYYSSILKYDYLLVDEVQDLPPKAIKLLLECASENVFFAGDTA
jgi:superfamily I DNA and RNA helicase